MPNIEALKQLRRVVVEAPDDRFDMETFCEERSCGTVHCALGWARVDGWHLKYTDIVNAIAFSDGAYGGAVVDNRVLGKIYGLRQHDTDRLFWPGEVNGPPISKDAVIANIDRLINGEWAIPYR